MENARFGTVPCAAVTAGDTEKPGEAASQNAPLPESERDRWCEGGKIS